MPSTPDITKGQIGTLIAALGAVIAIINQAPTRLQVPLIAAGAVLGAAYLIAEAVIRHGRAGAFAAVTLANGGHPIDASGEAPEHDPAAVDAIADELVNGDAAPGK